MHISKLHLRGWRNFKEIEAHLRPRVFIVGPNAVGKSNLLDAFRFLRDLASPGGGLSAAVESRGGVSLIRCLCARQKSDVAIGVAIAEDDGEPQWEYNLAIGQNNNRRPIVKKEVVLHKGRAALERPNEYDAQDEARLMQTALEQVSENKAFRPVADFFRSVSYQHIVPQVVRDPRGFSGAPVTNDPFGRDFSLRVWNTPKKTRDARLRNITKVLKAAIPQLVELEAVMDTSQGIPHLEGRFEHWRSHAARQNEAHFSDGTLRLLGLLWAVFEGEGPLLLEEPELSLHPEIVRRLPGLFSSAAQARKVRSRQIVASTYSREMLDDEGIGAEEVMVLQATEEGTVIRPVTDADRILLENGLTVADALLPASAPEKAYQMAFGFS